MKIVVVGGGAAGFFSALAAKEENPGADVLLLERSAHLLTKVRISGGGRCNVTHACFDPKELVKNYPRGSKELIGPFHSFQPLDTIDWFKRRGIMLKEEGDGRMFPITDSSETIINCFLEEARSIRVNIQTKVKVTAILRVNEGFEVNLGGKTLFADRVILATGSSQKGFELAKVLGHTVTETVPSLFTLKISSFPFVELAGVSAQKVGLKTGKFQQEGPLLLTHWGFSGPAALKLSAFAARFLAEKSYQAPVTVDWLPELNCEKIKQMILEQVTSHPGKQLPNLSLFPLPKSLFRALCLRSNLPIHLTLRQLSKASIHTLAETLKNDVYEIHGKTTNKEEFVTCGGILLSEVNFKTMESKFCPGLYFCGEVLDIDGVTGGFNFQNAWTTGWISGRDAAKKS